MKRVIILLVCTSLLLSACSNAQQLITEGIGTVQAADKTVSPTPAETSPAKPVFTLVPEEKLAPIPTDTPIQVTPGADTTLKDALTTAMNSPYWQKLGLPGDLLQKWQSFARGGTDLSQGDADVLAAFLAQWDHLNKLAKNELVSTDASLGFRAKELADAQGHKQWVLYAIDETLTAKEGAERLFLIARKSSGMDEALELAPLADGLNQRISADGKFVEYVQPGGKLVMQADAEPLGSNTEHEKQLREVLDKLYGNDVYSQAGIYPRFQYPLPDGQAFFFGIDKTLTYNQFVLLREALDLFNRPVFASMKPQLFGPGFAYMVVNRIGGMAAGVTYTGTGVVELDRQDLFGNKYSLMSVISHEGSHVLQGPLTSSGQAACQDMLRREIGDGTLPNGFYNWSADQLLQAIKDGKIGAYHVSLWTLTKLGIQDVGWIVEAIKTGKVGGQSVVNCNQ